MGGASAPSGREPSDWACTEEAARSPGAGAVGGIRELGEERSQRLPGLCTALPVDTCCGPPPRPQASLTAAPLWLRSGVGLVLSPCGSVRRQAECQGTSCTGLPSGKAFSGQAGETAPLGGARGARAATSAMGGVGPRVRCVGLLPRVVRGREEPCTHWAASPRRRVSPVLPPLLHTGQRRLQSAGGHPRGKSSHPLLQDSVPPPGRSREPAWAEGPGPRWHQLVLFPIF